MNDSTNLMLKAPLCGTSFVLGVASGLLVKALDCGSKDPEFQSQLQQRFTSLPGALSPTPKNEWRFTFMSFGGDIKPSVPGNPLKLA